MTRIASYDFLACDKCGQIHLKPNYASISSFIPADALIASSDIRTCFKCGDMKPLGSFIHIKSEPKPVKINNDFYLNSLKQFILRLIGSEVEVPEKDFRRRYPLI